MLHHHAGVLLDDDDVDSTGDLYRHSRGSEDSDDDDREKVHLLTVGGGGNCFSFGTHFNRRLMVLTIHSDRPETVGVHAEDTAS